MRTAREGSRRHVRDVVAVVVALGATWLAGCATEVAGGRAEDAGGGGAGGTSGTIDAASTTTASTGGAYVEDALTREVVERLSGAFDDEAQSTLDGLELSTLSACRAAVEGVDATALYLVQRTGGRVENEIVIVFDGPLGALDWRMSGHVVPVLVSPGEAACKAGDLALAPEAVGARLCETWWSPGESATPYVGGMCAPGLPEGQMLTLEMRDGNVTWREQAPTEDGYETRRTLSFVPITVDE